MKKLIISAMILLVTLNAFSQKRIAPKTREEKLNEEYCNGMFKSSEGQYFDLLNDNSATSVHGYYNILDWLQGRVASLQVFTLRDNSRLAVMRNSIAGIYVDEIQRTPDFLNSLPVSDIAMIKIIKGPFLGGFNSPGGAIAIYTIPADDEEEE
jgi:hypothetical protein